LRFIIFYILVFAAVSASGQVDVNRFQNILQSVSGGSAAYGSGFTGKYNLDSRVLGDVYQDSSFLPTVFHFKSSENTLVVPSRFDILNQEFEVLTTAGVRILRSTLVERYSVVDQKDTVRYLNAGNFTFEGTTLLGFFEVLAHGQVNLLKLKSLQIIKPSYNPSLEIGDRDARIEKKSALYFAEGLEVKKLKNFKKVLTNFQRDDRAVERFISENHLDVKNEKDLAKVFGFINKSLSPMH
jgi:hypothetical protein